MIFLWNFPLCVLAIAIALTVLRRLPRRERPHRLDLIGALGRRHDLAAVRDLFCS
jgi:hypothetical protein